MRASIRLLAASTFAPLLVTLMSNTVQAQSSMLFTPLAKRLTDTVVAQDLARFDSLSRVTSNARSGVLIGLARDAYERNDDGVLTTRLLAMASSTTGDPVARARRPELWALLDSVTLQPALSETVRAQAIALEVALLRASSPLLGAPSCNAWDETATRLAGLLREALKPRPAIAPPAPTLAVPAPSAPTPTAPRVLRAVPSRVHFALDKSTLAPASRRVLDALVDSLKQYSDVRVVLEGHTDPRGSVAYNAALSKRRVDAVRDYLVRMGLTDARMSTEARGKSKLERTERDITSHAVNRRVIFRFFDAVGREIATVGQLDDLQVERR